jgi:hypothetical protein
MEANANDTYEKKKKKKKKVVRNERKKIWRMGKK